jgi:hypothetical protein
MNDRANHSQLGNLNLNRPYSGVRRKDRSAEELNSMQSEVQLEEPFKRHNHISWNEAWCAENERERARLLSCHEIPTAGPFRLFAANVARELPGIKARAFRYLTWMSFMRRTSSSTAQKHAPVRDENQDTYFIMKPKENPGSPGKSI